LAGETAAALAAASIVFSSTNATYSALCLTHAKQLYSFGKQYLGIYSNSISAVCFILLVKIMKVILTYFKIQAAAFYS
jgi:hypothetical protein